FHCGSALCIDLRQGDVRRGFCRISTPNPAGRRCLGTCSLWNTPPATSPHSMARADPVHLACSTMVSLRVGLFRISLAKFHGGQDGTSAYRRENSLLALL